MARHIITDIHARNGADSLQVLIFPDGGNRRDVLFGGSEWRPGVSGCHETGYRRWLVTRCSPRRSQAISN